MRRSKPIEVNNRKLMIGVGLVVLGLLSPLLVSAKSFRIIDILKAAITHEQNGELLVASLLLVLLNSIRCLPHYLGTFLIIQSVMVENNIVQFLKNLILTVLIIAGVYYAIEHIFGIRYDFAVPALLMISVVVAVDRLDFKLVSILKEILMMAMLIVSIQFLDVMPGLSSTFFGRGELATDIKMTAEFLNAETLLRGMCLIFMAIFASFALILGMQISLENQLRRARQDSENSRDELMETRLRLLDARISKEQQFLVHDLKAPLTGIQLWTDLLQMKTEGNSCSDCAEYVEHINSSISHMNLLISELMNSRTKNLYTVQEIVKLFSSQTSPSTYREMLEICSECDDTRMELNRTNFVRALINLTDNAYHSIHHNDGRICLRVEAEGEYVLFSVSDNGDGIESGMLDRIWEKGVSGRGSSGVGLFYVKEVVEDLGGEVSIESKIGKGTTVYIRVPSHN